MAFLQKEALLQHIFHLLLLGEDLVFAKELEELSLRHLLLAFWVELASPGVLDKLHVLAKRKPVR